jgi:hypothetical protein
MENIKTILQAIRLTPPTGVCSSVDWKKQKEVARQVREIREINEAINKEIRK